MDVITIIPSRLASQRLPSKPLAIIGDKPMIAHVIESGLKANLGGVVLAVADQEIADACSKSGVLVVMTDPELPSGSDRVYAALNASKLNYDENTIILNLQGDMPFCPPEFLQKVCKVLHDHPEYDLATLVAPINKEEAASSSVVKVATSLKEDVSSALYFSRSMIPFNQEKYWGHIGLYAWRQKALKQFVEAPQGILEKAEKLEQLRALELGMKIGCASVSHFPISVDTEIDLEKARKIAE